MSIRPDQEGFLALQSGEDVKKEIADGDGMKQKIDRQADRLLTTGEAAELLGLSVQTIRTWCDQSRISYTRGASSGSRPGNRYISMAEIERILLWKPISGMSISQMAELLASTSKSRLKLRMV